MRETTTAASAVTRRSFVDGRNRTLSFALLFGLIAVANAVGYRRSYPTFADRLSFARTFGVNKVVQLFYGAPHDLLTVGGYVAWRVGGFGAVLAGLWGIFAATRALRAEEDAGRQELVLAGVLGRVGALGAALAGVALGAAVVAAGLWLGLVAGALAPGPSAYLAMTTVMSGLVFVGVGALTSQLASTRRVALELAAAALVISFLLRVVADTASGAAWLRWLTPLGWAEEARPFAGPRPAVLLLPVAATAALVGASTVIAAGRDVGRGLLPNRDTSPPRFGLLSSPAALAFRTQRGTLVAWAGGMGAFALIVGLLSTSFTTTNIPVTLREQLAKLGVASLTTPAGAIGFYFLLFTVAISLYACSQVSAARLEESEQRLETLLSLSVGRTRWLVGRLALAAGGAVAIAFTVAFATWVGAASQDAHVSLARMLEAGANVLPTVFWFLAVGMLAFALVPRWSTGIAYGLVALSFVWELFGALVGAPGWLLDVSPLHHLALVPAQPFRLDSSAMMLAIAALASLGAVKAFARRDLAGG